MIVNNGFHVLSACYVDNERHFTCGHLILQMVLEVDIIFSIFHMNLIEVKKLSKIIRS